MNAKYAIIIPVQNEEAVIGETLSELQAELPADAVITVGLNQCTDRSREICGTFKNVIIGETNSPGYGWGCQAAIEAVDQAHEIRAYLFYAGDGANRPPDLQVLIEAFEASERRRFIIGLRKFRFPGWINEFGRALPNLILGAACRAMGGQFFHDLGPLRLIESDLFHEMKLKEMVWGWTIEAQIKASLMRETISPVRIEERPRQGGEQKVSGVSLINSSRIGWEILKAAWRTRKSGI